MEAPALPPKVRSGIDRAERSALPCRFCLRRPSLYPWRSWKRLFPSGGGAQSTSKAYAAVGTDDYSKLFHCEQKSGYPGSISGNVLTYATTNWNDTFYNDPYKFYGEGGAAGNDWESSAFFFSDTRIPLAFDWEISFDVEQSALNYVVGTHGCVVNATQAGLSKYDQAAPLAGPGVGQGV